MEDDDAMRRSDAGREDGALRCLAPMDYDDLVKAYEDLLGVPPALIPSAEERQLVAALRQRSHRKSAKPKSWQLLFRSRRETLRQVLPRRGASR